jgi:hypothetical protein
VGVFVDQILSGAGARASKANLRRPRRRGASPELYDRLHWRSADPRLRIEVEVWKDVHIICFLLSRGLVEAFAASGPWRRPILGFLAAGASNSGRYDAVFQPKEGLSHNTIPSRPRPRPTSAFLPARDHGQKGGILPLIGRIRWGRCEHYF